MFGDVPVIYAPGVVSSSGVMAPSDHNLIAWSFDPSGAIGVYQPNSGIILLIKVRIPVATTVGKIYFHVAGAATGPITGQNEVGLYDTLGSRLAAANVDSDITSAGVKGVTIPGTPLTTGYCWIAMVFNCTVATPFIAQAASITSASSLVNVGLSAAVYRYARNGTGTVLPASITPGSNVAHDTALWAAVGQ